MAFQKQPASQPAKARGRKGNISTEFAVHQIRMTEKEMNEEKEVK